MIDRRSLLAATGAALATPWLAGQRAANASAPTPPGYRMTWFDATTPDEGADRVEGIGRVHRVDREVRRVRRDGHRSCLDPGQAVADLDVSQAQANNARSQLQRSEELHQAGVITDQELESARLQFTNAQAGLTRSQTNKALAELQLGDTATLPGGPHNAPPMSSRLQRAPKPSTVSCQ